MWILAAIYPPDTAGAILRRIGLPARAPPVASVRHAAGELRLLELEPDWSRG